MTPSDWMEMTPADWMSMGPFDWMNQAVSGWNRSYSDWMNMRPSDWWGRVASPGTRVGRAGWAPEREREKEWEWERWRHGPGCECEDCHDYRRKRHHDRCRRCGSDSCECYCCIGDVDLAVYAYFGEQRVIPILVENERHREKQINLELSQWTTAGGRTGLVDTVRLDPQTFTLAPCGEQNITLVVAIREDQTGGDTPGSTDNPDQPRQTRDVDQCLVVTADLRLVGCDHRPLRIAVAILPRSCDPYRVGCGCTCC